MGHARRHQHVRALPEYERFQREHFGLGHLWRHGHVGNVQKMLLLSRGTCVAGHLQRLTQSGDTMWCQKFHVRRQRMGPPKFTSVMWFLQRLPVIRTYGTETTYGKLPGSFVHYTLLDQRGY